MVDWELLKPKIKKIAGLFRDKGPLYSKEEGAIRIDYYYCNHVERLVEFIRTNTKAKIISNTHDVLLRRANYIRLDGKGKDEEWDGRRYSYHPI